MKLPILFNVRRVAVTVPKPATASIAVAATAAFAASEPVASATVAHVSAPLIRRKNAPPLTREEVRELSDAGRSAMGMINRYPVFFTAIKEEREEFLRIFCIVEKDGPAPLAKALEVLNPCLETYGRHGVRPCLYVHGEHLREDVAAIAKKGKTAWQLCGRGSYLLYPRAAVLSVGWMTEALQSMKAPKEYGIAIEFPTA